MYTKKTHRTVWSIAAAALAIAALIYNPCHLFTASLLAAFAWECGPEAEEDKI
ncbi:MAG: hypothetical protein IKW20_06550 [Bacteroidales bacterium]|nr:hypothetical protein [Bacteroidales bacterium]